MIYKLIVFLFLLKFSYSDQSFLQKVDEEELLVLIRNEKFVVVLFTKPNCEACEKLESALINIREDLVDSLNCWVVKAENSYLVKLYNPTKEPSLVFFRHGVPLLYDGDINEDLILHVFSDNKDPIVKELSDENFEFLTQAASGATTGDWFIMFYTNDCVDCQRLQARWEAVGAKLKTRLNVARLNKKTSAVTARRFNVAQVPYFLFFRLGKMYHYNIPKHDVPSFVSFASDWYKNAKSEKVPIPKSPFDDLVQQIVDLLKESTLVTGLVIFSFLAILVFAIYALRSKSAKPKEGDKKYKVLKDSTKSEKQKKSK
ncbi:protein disulfide-isomerase A4 [Halyomorpha halys]|uniref:protein disulfide-isomerase A4 n=1 Tax=Halyomorpha halys TaxID=286706 RepID=UPI0006D51726|nr:protein disulfide-isomerase A4 [Halyomorpha halys]